MKTLHKVIAVASLLAITTGTAVYAATVITPPADQAVTVSAAVAPYLTLAVSNNSIDMGTLNVGSTTVAAAAHTVTADSNGTDYAVSYTVAGANTAHTANVLAMAGATGDAATAQIGLTVTPTGATIGTPGAGQVISHSAFTSTPSIATIGYTAASATGKQAGAYSTTVTYTASGNF